MQTKEQAFIIMITEHQGILHKICNAYSGPADRDDLFQEILLHLWQSIDSFKGKSKPGTWIYKVALYTALNYQRKETLRTHDALQDNMPARNTNTDAKEVIHFAMALLKPEEKAILILHMEDYSYEEISEILGITISNAGARLTRIRKKLKEIIEKI